uniref:Riboflavin kinase n=2 Tax=Clastoptera arizonana TaxID=38151 RepID=A0A1B6DQB9_9HEMI
MICKKLPFFASGEIIQGFGRGSKQLGIPTANYKEDVVNSLPDQMNAGIYCGWAQVDNGPVYEMVMSIGWNPFYNNEKKSMETHILHEFNRDLYGCLLKTCILYYIRPEKNFSSMDDLVKEINNDIAIAKAKLATPEFKGFKSHQFFSSTTSNS